MKSHILYEDNSIIVCHKPAGVATQTARVGQQDMVSKVARYLASSGKVGGSKADKRKKPGQNSRPYVGVVHRLDQPVEGILIFAKDKESAASLSGQIAGDRTEKYYYAVVCGQELAPGGELVDYLLRNGRTNTSEIVTKEVKDAKEARLSYEILQENAQCLPDGTEMKIALARIRLQTGRHHQIRVQLRSAGMSILGDYKYADETAKRLSEQLQVKEIALCACELTFTHPKTGKKMNFKIKPEGKIFQLFSV